jgi:hypothetical protein
MIAVLLKLLARVAPAQPPMATAETVQFLALRRQGAARLTRPAWERRICR